MSSGDAAPPTAASATAFLTASPFAADVAEAAATGGVGLDGLARVLATEHERVSRVRAAAVPPVPGDLDAVALPDPYDDRGELGRGGMGAVRRAFDRDLGRAVAVKALLPELGTDPRLTELFVAEARVTALIEHPGVAPVYGLARAADGSPLLVMKLIDGQTLRERLHELPDPPWPPMVLDEVLTVLVRVCDAVAFAHSRGVVNLDLKSDNVMLGPFGQVYVVDWGIARHRVPDGEEAVGTPPSAERVSTGTPAYMSPEQVLFSEPDIDGRTDVYLIGGLLYEILTGLPPHGGTSVVEVLAGAISGRVAPPAERVPGRSVPPALAAIAMRALQPHPDDRYQSVLDLQRDVRAYQRGEERAPRRTYAAGSLVVREGDPGDEAFVVVSGRCRVFTSVDGERRVLRELGPGDLFGETAVVSDQPRTASVEAVDEVVVRVVTRDLLTQSLGLDTWAGSFVRTLAERFSETDRRARSR